MASLELFMEIVKSERPGIRDNWNIAPTNQAPIIWRADGTVDGGFAKWGLVPSWAKEPLKISTFNAKSERLLESNLWRSVIDQRCLVPVSCFYEWKTEGSNKRPHWIGLEEPMFFAGLHNATTYEDRGETRVTDSFTVITCPANAQMEHLHHRMPVILTPEDCRTWLEAPTEIALEVCRPYQGELKIYEVERSALAKKNGPECWEPAIGRLI